MIYFTERISQLQLLSENYEIVKEIINTFHESVIIVNKEGRITDWNIISEQFIGISQKKAIGADFLEILKKISGHIERSEEIKDNLVKNVIDFKANQFNKKEKYFNLLYRKIDGELIFVRTLLIELTLSGSPLLVIISKEVENNPKLTGKATEQKKLFNHIFNNEAIGIAICSPTCQFINVNNKLLSMLEYNIDEIVSFKIEDITYKDDIEKEQQIFQKVIQKKLKKYTIEKRVVKKNADILWVKVNAIFNWTAKKELESIACFIEDITLHRKVEEALKESEKKYRFVAEKASDIIYSISLDSRITFYNRVVEQIFEISIEELESHTYDYFMSMADKEYAKELHQQRLQGIKSPIFKHKFITPTGKIVYLEFSVSPLFDDNNKVIGSLGIARDVTARVIAEQEITQKNNELEYMVKTKDKFLSVIAHDLKNPFNTLIGFSNVLLDNFNMLSDNDKQKYIRIINSSANNGFDLLKNLLDWARSQSGQIKFTPRRINASINIVNSIQNLKYSAEVKNIEIVFNGEKEVYLETDETMFNTIMRNLLTNAIKFSFPDSTIIVSIEENKSNIKIQVRDFGVGINEEDIKLLFTSSIVDSKEGTSHEYGTGLGLLICNEFAAKMGGTISVESKLGEGSKFAFTLPMNKAKK